jgi:hypothetical protein
MPTKSMLIMIIMGKKKKKIEIEKENIGENVDDKKLNNLSGNTQNNKLKKKFKRFIQIIKI